MTRPASSTKTCAGMLPPSRRSARGRPSLSHRPSSALCVDALSDHRRGQAQRRHARGGVVSDTDLVFSTADGGPLDAGNVRRDFRKAIQAAPGVDPADWTPRELRHSFVSVLSDSGVPLEEISRLLGHKSTLVTEVVYRKQLRPVMQAGAVAMDRVFGAGASRLPGTSVTQIDTQHDAKEEK